mgnify:CR=1 FL=1
MYQKYMLSFEKNIYKEVNEIRPTEGYLIEEAYSDCVIIIYMYIAQVGKWMKPQASAIIFELHVCIYSSGCSTIA